jgi:uncharacterized membrane protein YfcA
MSELVCCHDIATPSQSGTVRRGAAAIAITARRTPLPVIALVPAALVLLGRWTLGSGFERDAATAGFLVGVLVGLTGMGSGALMTPILILVVGIPPVTAVGTDLAYAAITKLVGGWQHARQGTVDRQLVRSLATGSVPGALAGVAVIVWLERRVAIETFDAVLRRGLGIVLIVAAVGLLAGALQARRQSAAPRPASRSLTGRRAIALGAGVGFMVGLTSVGSGSLVVAVLSLMSPLSAATIVGTDVAHAAILTSTAGLAHGISGNVDVVLALSLLAGSLPGVLLGSSFSLRVPPEALRLVLAGVLIASAVALF